MSVDRQTRRGHSGLLVVAFATPFAVMAGSGGYSQAQPFETSGNSIFVIGANQPTNEQKEMAVFFKDVSRFINDYGLGKNQISSLLNVSRPTINSWIAKDPSKIREQHRTRLSDVLSIFDQQITTELRYLLGAFLQRKLDPTVQKMWDITSNSVLLIAEIEPVLKTLNFKLSGITRSNRLSEVLSDKKPLI